MKVEISENKSRKGLQLQITGKLSEKDKSFLEALGFIYNLRHERWHYRNYNQTVKMIANQVKEALENGKELSTIRISSSFDKTDQNIADEKFSLVRISITDKEGKTNKETFVLFEPLKRIAEKIARDFAGERYPDQPVAIEVHARNYKTEARAAFKEGKIISRKKRSGTIPLSGFKIDDKQSLIANFVTWLGYPNDKYEQPGDVTFGVFKDFCKKHYPEIREESIMAGWDAWVMSGKPFPITDIPTRFYNWALINGFEPVEQVQKQTFETWIKDHYPQTKSTKADKWWQEFEESKPLLQILVEKAGNKPLSEKAVKYLRNLSKKLQHAMFAADDEPEFRIRIQGSDYEINRLTDMVLSELGQRNYHTLMDWYEAIIWKFQLGDIVPGTEPKAGKRKIREYLEEEIHKKPAILEFLLNHLFKYEQPSQQELRELSDELEDEASTDEPGPSEASADNNGENTKATKDNTNEPTDEPGQQQTELSSKRKLEILNEFGKFVEKRKSESDNIKYHELPLMFNDWLRVNHPELVEQKNSIWKEYDKVKDIPNPEPDKPQIPESDHPIFFRKFRELVHKPLGGPEDESTSAEAFTKWLGKNYRNISQADTQALIEKYDSWVKSLEKSPKRIENLSKPEKLQPYSANYNKLKKIVPDLIENLNKGYTYGKSSFGKGTGMMDLNLNVLYKEEGGGYVIALSHYFKQQGEMISDPDMQLRIDPEMETVEAMTYQDQFGFRQVYHEKEGKTYVDTRAKKELNVFLSQWLTNIINQKHSIVWEEPEQEDQVSPYTSYKDFEAEVIRQMELTGNLTTSEIQDILTRHAESVASRFYDTENPTEDGAKRIAEEVLNHSAKKPKTDKLQKFAALLSKHRTIDGYMEGGKIKQKFGRLGKQAFKELALYLGLEPYEVSFNKAGVAVSGDLLLRGMLKTGAGIYISLNKDGINDQVLYRMISQMKDFTGGANHYFKEELLASPEQVKKLVNALDNSPLPETQKVDKSQIPETTEKKSIDPNEPPKVQVKDINHYNTIVKNVLIPQGIQEPFASADLHIKEAHKVREAASELLQFSDDNLHKASAIQLFQLTQMSHPSDYGFNVSRSAVLREWEKRGKQPFQELGYPTELNYPYVNMNVGYKSVDTLESVLTDQNHWWAVAELYRPVADLSKGIGVIDDLIEDSKTALEALLNPNTQKPKSQHKEQANKLLWQIESLEASKEAIAYFLSTEVSQDKTPPNKEKKPTQQEGSASQKEVPKNDYIDRVIAHMHQQYAERKRVTKTQVEKLAKELNVPNMGMMWEAVELSWLLWYKMLYKDNTPFETRLERMVDFWDKIQPTYAYSDSSKELYRQYSTPCPITAIVSEYTGMPWAKNVFEPSAGNGLLVLGAKPQHTHVNEIDKSRLASLKFQEFKKITQYNAAKPFPEELNHAFDVMVTNPPFSRWEEEKFDKEYIVKKYFSNHIGLAAHIRLEHLMAGLALHTLKDSGKAAIILMGHVYFGHDGFIAKYRPFFNWLYRHYKVDDVINLNSFKLYNKQGAIEKTMLILIGGRKHKPQGVAPTQKEAPWLYDMVNSFKELWDRVKSHIKDDLDTLIHQLNIELDT